MASFGGTVFERMRSDISRFCAMSSLSYDKLRTPRRRLNREAHKLDVVAFSTCSSKPEFPEVNHPAMIATQCEAPINSCRPLLVCTANESGGLEWVCGGCHSVEGGGLRAVCRSLRSTSPASSVSPMTFRCRGGNNANARVCDLN